ncbi:hypothetical protein Bcep22_gp31 [Burkholderia phage Bcep22]|uniref:Uncharacterized protein n=1 Tax=Burkholderia phage Bcep22 TaxID=2883944 RepID=Q6V7R2_9CAUD|nr:hypothetical protein Bcep22_gp31 [Burkholderia phage Bcep22]AAQ54964.2 hypothetical protein Bcep22_gp31 [Burkholderia phage Bcep22]
MSDTETAKPGTDIALLPPAERALVVLKSTEAEKQLRELVARTAPIGAPVDAAGREEVHRAAMDHKNARVAIEKAGKAAREDATAFSKAVITEEKRLVAINSAEETRLFELRDTYDTKVRQEKEEADRKERERVAAIREKIDAIKNLPVDSAADNAETLGATLDDLRSFEITFEDFAEFQDEARAARDASIGSLTTMHGHAVAREAAAAAAREAEEKLAAQRAELERQQRELAEQQAEIARQRAELEAAKKPAVVAGPNEPEPEVVGTVKRADDTLLEFEAERKASLNPAYDPFDPGNWRDGNAAVDSYEVDHGTHIEHRPIYGEPPIGADANGEQVAIVIASDAAPEVRTFFDVAAGPDETVEMVTITREEYDSLVTRSNWLECLEAAGVDNWEGIDEALRLNRERVPA